MAIPFINIHHPKPKPVLKHNPQSPPTQIRKAHTPYIQKYHKPHQNKTHNPDFAAFIGFQGIPPHNPITKNTLKVQTHGRSKKMIYPITELATAVQPKDSPADHLAWLAKTYDRIAQPVWIYDLSANCLYRNRSAKSEPSVQAPMARFDILDHDDRIIGHLATITN
jgi:hypothetical protein